MTYRNPVIPGFHPDPSVCRVGRDYYLATSSFEYFPGVPLFHSRDLVNWRQMGHCLTRPEQLPLEGVASSCGVFAPTLRHYHGRFYMVTTIVGGAGHLYVHADHPGGEWSDPVWVEGDGFDPDLFWDEEGTCYFTRRVGGEGIWQWKMNIETGGLLDDGRQIWPGMEDIYAEGPHVYFINGSYYLMVAEGGTHRGHMVVVARADRPEGPYEPCPHNPVLSHRGRVHLPIQATGHADLVQAHDGSWWLVFLGIRQVGWGYHHLGRETFLAPVTWDAHGWPVVNGGEPAALEMEADHLPPDPWPEPPVRDEFDGIELCPCWNFRRGPHAGDWSLQERPGHLRLWGTEVMLDEEDMRSPTFVGRRQQHFACRAEALLDFQPERDGEEAGLTAFMNEAHHYEMAVALRDGQRRVAVRRRVGDLHAVVAEEAMTDGPLRLRITAEPELYRFGCAAGAGPLRELATGRTRYLSSEVAGGFTGVYFGLYATGNGRPCDTPADFAWFDYEPESE